MSAVDEQKDVQHETVSRVLFGVLEEGTPVHLFRLGRRGGPSVSISEQGCSLVEMLMPDRNGELANVILRYPSLEGYLHDRDYLGATVGRVANRIAGSSLTLDGEKVSLTANIPPHHLHGGKIGFNKHRWDGEIVRGGENPTVRFHRTSPDGEEGYPGSLDVAVEFTFREEQHLDVKITATSDAPTMVNMTLHPYFNLAGDRSPILSHELTIRGGRFLPMNDSSLPTGEVRSVTGTPMDFRTSNTLGALIDSEDEQLAHGGGYDHCWVIDGERGSIHQAAHVHDPASGRTLDLYTSETGMQLYTGNMLGDSGTPEGEKLVRRTGFCLEPQNWPDAPNNSEFPSARLDPGETYIHQIRYSFGCSGDE